ncbi:SusC/RagA family TonB-linked outer membrane protein [Chitinophaga defluvii]|uniref:SusC/RagA family TonB-linked outer membrane protein n=1 Tax=Chitinophaga defluvii TaxID=3163343 RepID=A0ABV2T9Q8_9BACT
MQLTSHCKASDHPARALRRNEGKTRYLTKWPIALLIMLCLHIGQYATGQQVTLSKKEASLKTVLFDIQQQTGYNFLFKESMLQKAKPVTINVKDAPLATVLESIFKDQPLTYSIKDKSISIAEDEKRQSINESAGKPLFNVTGTIVNSNGEPVVGATVLVKGTAKAISTTASGEYSFSSISGDEVLVVSGAEIETTEVKVANRTFLPIRVSTKVGELDQVLVQGYGTTTKRLSTGSIARVTSKEIAQQPVTNPLLALQGRVPGLIVTQTNGYGSGSISIQVRGKNSILQNSDPFIIVDGVPLSPQNDRINLLSNASMSGVSPLYTINPQDIESIEVLKDADATAIYGSRGANGVVLITTKKGKQGKLKIDANIYSGWSRVTRTMDMMNTSEYVQMRREAFSNDGLVPTEFDAADILLWDTTRYTDMKKLFLGGTAGMTNANISLSGGSENTHFIISGNYVRTTTVLPTNLADHRISGHSSISQASRNKRFSITLSTSYSYTRNSVPNMEVSQFINRPPNIKLYDSIGNLNWEEGGVSFYEATYGIQYSNPLAALYAQYLGNYSNLNSSIRLNYDVYGGIGFKINAGYNSVTSEERSLNPSKSLDPFDNLNNTPSASFARGSNANWIVEPQVIFKRAFPFGRFDAVLGSTIQKQSNAGLTVFGSDYQDDALLGSISGAGKVFASNAYSQYRYAAVFGRISYNFNDKYLLNLSGRRDGSSRFGYANQFANFGAVGAGWIFSKEEFFSKHLPWLNFGKLKASYGVTGNDGIGNYAFLDTWSSSGSTYQGIPSLNPSTLFNPLLAWELNKKINLGIDIAVLAQRFQFSVEYFRNRSSNQLVNYSLPIQTGFSSVLANRKATVQNTGFELALESANIKTHAFEWTSRLNISFIRNKLIAFPAIEKSSYANTLFVGQSLSTKALYQFAGIDQTTGLYAFVDVNGDGILNGADKVVFMNTDPKCYGGLQNTVRIGSFQADFLLQFTHQKGRNYLGTIGGYPPGIAFTNQPQIALNRWQKEQDNTDIQKYTTTPDSKFFLLQSSDIVFSNASFVRLKNIAISYNVPPHVLRKLKVEQARLYVQGQNIFTITDYIGADPETQNMYAMPPLRTITVGIQLTL